MGWALVVAQGAAMTLDEYIAALEALRTEYGGALPVETLDVRGHRAPARQPALKAVMP